MRSSLADLFEGRRQLIVQHFMFDPSWDDGCPSCTAGFRRDLRGLLSHLHVRDTTLAVVSRAPLAKLEDYKAPRDGPSRGTRRSAATSTTTTTSRSTRRWHRSSSTSATPTSSDARHGVDAAKARRSSRVTACSCATATTCSTRTPRTRAGTEWLGGSYAFLDLTALGRQEEWEEPKGRAAAARPAVPDFS